MRSMIICVCNRVSDRDIARAVADGCETFDELQFETGVGTCCGCCHDCARQTFEQHAGCATAAEPSIAGMGATPVVMHRSVARAANAAALAATA